MLRARNVADAQVQIFVANDELLLPILKTFKLFTGLYTILEMLDVFSLCVVPVLYIDGIHTIVLIVKLWYFIFKVKITIYPIQKCSAFYIFQ